MNKPEPQSRRLLKNFQSAMIRFRLRFAHTVDAAGSVVGIISSIAAVGALVALILYAGFDSSSISRPSLMKWLHISQFIFFFSVVFNYVLRPAETLKNTHFIKLVAEIGIVLSVAATLIPDSNHWPWILRWITDRYFFFSVTGLYAVAELSYAVTRFLGRHTNPSLMLSASFLIFILIGSFVLMMPRFTRVPVSWEDTLFVAASAVSMTGLTTVDVASTFTTAGHIVLILLMEIGALGVLTFTSFFSVFFSGQRSIYNQLLMRDFIYSKSMSALIPMLLYILGFTLAIEAIGAVGIYLTLPQSMFADTGSRILTAVFHSVAAFTNSGFSTLPEGLATPQLLHGNMVIYLVLTLMIFAGGIGFPNLVNFKDACAGYLRRLKSRITGAPVENRRFHVYDLNTKLVLYTTGILFAGGAIVFFICEHDHSLAGMSLWQKIVMSVFYSATTRSAGFAPVSPAMFLNVTLLVMMFLMWVGGSSQSMAGGIKVNTFGAAMLNLKSLIRGESGVTAFGRRIAVPSIRRANGVIFLSVLTIVVITAAMLAMEPMLGAKAVIFETLSAVTTNGLSLGITPELSTPSKYLLSATMFIGRVGLLSMLAGMARRSRDNSIHYPTDDIIIS